MTKLTPSEALAALDTFREPTYRHDAVAAARRYVECTGIVPEWLEKRSGNRNGWTVVHNGERHKTYANGERDAINKVRYRLYGEKPESDLPDFRAEPTMED